MASIVRRSWTDKNGEQQTRYDAYVSRRGFKKQVRTFKTKGLAQRWVKLTEADLERGTFKSTAVAESMTLREAMRRYLDEVAPNLRGGAALQTYADTIEAFLGAYPIIALDGEILAGYRDKRLGMKVRSPRSFKGGRVEIKLLRRNVATATVRHELTFIGRVIDHGRREWGIHLPGGNPLALVKLPGSGKPRDRRLVGDEEARILAQLGDECGGQRNPYMKSLFVFAIETASRRSEMIRLQWSDVDLKRRTALLRNTKNGSDREIGLSTRAVEALMAIPRSRDGRVFPVSANAVRLAWRRLVARCDISGLKFHDLRHEGASRLCERLSGDVMALSAMTGHKSLQMLKRYTHPRAEDLARRLG